MVYGACMTRSAGRERRGEPGGTPGEDPRTPGRLLAERDLRWWQRAALTVVGLVVMLLVLPEFGRAGAWVFWGWNLACSVGWGVIVTLTPEDRAAWRERGWWRFVGTLPFVGPFALGLLVWMLIEVIGGLGF